MAEVSEYSCSTLPVLSNVVIWFWKLFYNIYLEKRWDLIRILQLSLDSDLLIGPEHNVKS